MKIISWNTRAIMGQSKQLAIKTLLKKVNPDIVMIEETKREEIDSCIIKALWSSKGIGWDLVEANGRSGGLLIVWDESKQSVLEVLKRGYSISIKCSTINRKICAGSQTSMDPHIIEIETKLVGVVSSVRPLYRSLVFGWGFQHYSEGTREISSTKINKGNEKI